MLPYLVFDSLDQYYKLLTKGIYKGKKFERCRHELRENLIGLSNAIIRQASPKYQT